VRIEGVRVRKLEAHRDSRGSFTEIFRDSWFGNHPVQWNLGRSETGVLRGVHGHFRHSDYLVVLEGSMTIGLKDLRPDSATHDSIEMVLLAGENPKVLTIPTGVAHGFYFHCPTTHITAVTHYWDVEDELGCQWNDPALGLPWPCVMPRISARDAGLPTFSVFREQMEANLAAYASGPKAG
jgi:dTDP-4-dehydrorhamnose 3,5-epimerase